MQMGTPASGLWQKFLPTLTTQPLSDVGTMGIAIGAQCGGSERSISATIARVRLDVRL
jgi:hypothetical protein